MKPGRLLLTALLLLGSTVACGELDPSAAPVDAKRSEFCAGYARLAKASAATSADTMNDYLNEFARFGTPRGIPTAARNGFEYLIDPDSEITSANALAVLTTRTDGVGQDAQALAEYVKSICS